VIEADGAVSALRLLDGDTDIQLLFTDIVMPDMNGARLAEEARRRRPDLKVLYTTGYSRNAVIHNGVLDAGVHIIMKPYSSRRWRGRCVRYLRRKSRVRHEAPLSVPYVRARLKASPRTVLRIQPCSTFGADLALTLQADVERHH
jgi:DNA-binding LytR/AlgR family response regulator